MTVYDIIKANFDGIRLLRDNDITFDDAARLDLYEEYVALRSVPDLKVTYIIMHLAEKWRLSEKQVRRIVGKLGREIPAPNE